MNGQDEHGCVPSTLSVTQPHSCTAEDGILPPNTITPDVLGYTPEESAAHLVGILRIFTVGHGFHMNVNVLGKAPLANVVAHPENHPQLTLRVPGHTVNFERSTRELQLDVVHHLFCTVRSLLRAFAHSRRRERCLRIRLRGTSREPSTLSKTGALAAPPLLPGGLLRTGGFRILTVAWDLSTGVDGPGACFVTVPVDVGATVRGGEPPLLQPVFTGEPSP